uniref:Leukotriene C4 synthase n=1 Tax=Nomascus leucogenys TaxID=61853 RepID=G1QM57_NOMLE
MGLGKLISALSSCPLSERPSKQPPFPGLLQRHLHTGTTWSRVGTGPLCVPGFSPALLAEYLTPAPPPPAAYFSLQVISARRAFRVSPPLTTGPPEFERVYRAQVNCSEYFPLFLATLWVAGIFFHEGAAALCGLVYLFARLRYFQGYARSAQL